MKHNNKKSSIRYDCKEQECGIRILYNNYKIMMNIRWPFVNVHCQKLNLSCVLFSPPIPIPYYPSKNKKCLKIIQNVSFEFFNYGIFHQFLSCLLLVTLFDRKLQILKNSPNWPFLVLLIKWDFFCDFQTPWNSLLGATLSFQVNCVLSK